MPPFASQTAWKVTPAGTAGLRCKAVRSEQGRLVVAEQAADVALAPEPHGEIDSVDPVRPTIDEIADQPEPCICTRPGQPLVEEPGVAKHREQGLDVPVDVSDHKRRHVLALPLGSGGRRLARAAAGPERPGHHPAESGRDLERVPLVDQPLQAA